MYPNGVHCTPNEEYLNLTEIKVVPTHLYWFKASHSVYSHVPNSRGVTLALWPKKMPKMAILQDKLKDFEKTKRDEAMK